MDKICINNKVRDAYEAGLSANDAIREVYGDVLDARIEENPHLDKLTPLQIALHDAGISKLSTVGKMMDSATYTSNGMDSNEWLFPIWIETTLRETQGEPNYISYITSNTQTVDSNIIKSAMLDLTDEKNKANLKKMRVAEGADLPLAKLTIGEQAISLWKRGRAIQMTYEAMRHIRLDLFARHIAMIANDVANQEIEFATDVLAGGDGNDGTEPTKIGATATAGTITNDEIIDFLYDYSIATGINANVLIAPTDIAKKLSSMVFDTQLGSGASANITFNMPQFASSTVTVIASDLAVVDKKPALLLSNRENTLIKYVENGSMIQETQQFIRNQTRLMTISENSGYAISTAGTNMYVELKQL